MKIFFVGNTKTPFIRQDLELLSESHQITSIFMPNFSASKIIRYQLEALKEWTALSDSDLVWIWFADYPALPIILIAKLLKKPIVVNIGGWEVSKLPEVNYGAQLSPIRGFLCRWIIRNADRCVVPSPKYRDITTKLVPGSNVVVIPNWIDTKMCEEAIPNKKDIAITACCADSAKDSKGVPFFENISKNLPYSFEVLGSLPRAEYISKLKEAKVYCQFSRCEAFGISLLEAMAYGCIPVVFNTGALPWVVGDGGYVVPYGDAMKAEAAIVAATASGDHETPRVQARTFSRERKVAAVTSLIKEITK